MRKINYLLMSVVAAHLFTESGAFASGSGSITESLINSWSESDHSAFAATHGQDFADYDKLLRLAQGRLALARIIAALDENEIKVFGQNLDWILDGIPESDRTMRQNKLLRISKRPANIGLSEFVGTELFSKLESPAQKSEAFSAFRFSAKEMKKPVILKGNASVDEQLLAAKEFGSGAKKAAFEKAQADGIITGLSSLEDVRSAVDFYKQKKNQTEAAKLAPIVSASAVSFDSMSWNMRQELIKKVDDAQKTVANIRAAEMMVATANESKSEEEKVMIDAVSDLKLIDYILGSTQIQPVDHNNVASIINDVKVREISNPIQAPYFLPESFKASWGNADAIGRRMMSEFFTANMDRSSVYTFAIEKGIVEPIFAPENQTIVNELVGALRNFDRFGNIQNIIPQYLFDHLDDSVSGSEKKAVVLKYLEMPSAGSVPNKRIVELSQEKGWIEASHKYTDAQSFFDAMKNKYDIYMSELAELSSWQNMWIEQNLSYLTMEQKAKVKISLGNGDVATAPIIDETHPLDSFVSDALWQDKPMWAHWKTGMMQDSHMVEWLESLMNPPVGDMASINAQYATFRQSHPIMLAAEEILARALNMTDTSNAIAAAMNNPSDPVTSFFVLGVFDFDGEPGIVFNPDHTALYNEAVALMRLSPATPSDQIIPVLQDLKLDKQNLKDALPSEDLNINADDVVKSLLSIGLTDGDVLPFESGEALPEKGVDQSDESYIQTLAKFFVLRSINAFEEDPTHSTISIDKDFKMLYSSKELFSFDSSNKDHRVDYINDVLSMHQALMGLPTSTGEMPYSILMSNLSNAQKGLVIKYLLDSGFKASDIKAPNSGDVAGMVASLLERATFIALNSIGALDGEGLTGSDIPSMLSYFKDELYRLRQIKNTFVFSQGAEYSKDQRVATLDEILDLEEEIPASFLISGSGVFEKSSFISAMRSVGFTPSTIEEVSMTIGEASIPDHTSAYERAVYLYSLIVPSGN